MSVKKSLKILSKKSAGVLAQRVSAKWPLIIAGVEVAAISIIGAYFLIFNLPDQNFYTLPASAASDQAPSKINSEIPVRLMIPKIKLNIALESVGLTSWGGS
jgi:hypothetical protein